MDLVFVLFIYYLYCCRRLSSTWLPGLDNLIISCLKPPSDDWLNVADQLIPLLSIIALSKLSKKG